MLSWIHGFFDNSSYSVIVRVRIVLKRPVVGDRRFNNLSGSRVKSQVKTDWSVETDWSDSCKVSIQSWVGFDPSMVSQLEDCVLLVKLSQYVRSPFVSFVYVVDKSFVRRNRKPVWSAILSRNGVNIITMFKSTQS